MMTMSVLKKTSEAQVIVWAILAGNKFLLVEVPEACIAGPLSKLRLVIFHGSDMIFNTAELLLGSWLGVLSWGNGLGNTVLDSSIIDSTLNQPMPLTRTEDTCIDAFLT